MTYSPLELNGKVAVVVGGTSGIGRAIAHGFAQAGADVIPTSRRPEQVDAAAALDGEVEVVDAIVHLGLLSEAGLKADHGGLTGARSQLADARPNLLVPSGKPLCLQLLPQPPRGELRVTPQQLLQGRVVGMSVFISK